MLAVFRLKQVRVGLQGGLCVGWQDGGLQCV
jgi:hypothetical protein